MPPVFRADQKPDHDRGQRAREAIGGEHGEHDRHREWREQIACCTLQEKHRDKHATDGERRYQGRHGDSGRTLEHSLVERLPLLQQTMGIFDRDRAVVDKYADRQCQAAERHGVDGQAQRREDRDRCQDR